MLVLGVHGRNWPRLHYRRQGSDKARRLDGAPDDGTVEGGAVSRQRPRTSSRQGACHGQLYSMPVQVKFSERAERRSLSRRPARRCNMSAQQIACEAQQGSLKPLS